MFKRSLAAVLCLVLVLGMVPVLGGKIALKAEAAPVDAQDNAVTDYITLPITIRDFAADGMLFEWNETGVAKSGDGVTYDTVSNTEYVAYTVQYNPWYWDLYNNDYTGIRVYHKDYNVYDSQDNSSTDGAAWSCVILDANGNVLKVLDREGKKNNIDTVVDQTEGAVYSVWAWRDDKNLDYYPLVDNITEENKDNYRFVIDGLDTTQNTTTTMYIGSPAYVSASQWNQGTTESPDYTGLRVYKYGDLLANTLGDFDAWHCVICDASGNVVCVIPRDRDKVEDYASYMKEGYFSVWAWSDPSNTFAYNKLSQITNINKAEYDIHYLQSGSEGALFIDHVKYNYYKESGGTKYYYSNTKGFTFLQTDVKDYIDVMPYTDGAYNPIAGTERTQLGSWNSAPSTETLSMTLNSGAKQTLIGGWIRTNLVAAELDDDRKPVYTAATVEYLAGYMADVMGVEWQNADGSYNTYHVEGVKLFDETWNYVSEGSTTPKVYDLADFIRHKIANNGLDDDMGSYAVSHAKFSGEIYGKSLDTANDIETWCDAAYYLLHYYWRDSQFETKGGAGSDGYGMKMPQYSSLQLVKKEVDGQTVYVFNSGYDETRYDTVAGEIYNTQTDTMTTSDNPEYVYGNPLTTNRFDPLGLSGGGYDLGYGMSGDTYGNMTPGVEVNEFYSYTNYNLSLEGHAEFVYHYASDLYFTFTGDDDVYLYINGIRVLDVGAAHSIAKVKISLNDIATTCGLKEGEPARFDFFYLERHGSAANFGIETNIQLAESGMITTKNGYQNGTTTGYDGPVNPDNPVAYSFTLKNSDAATLENLTFKDDNLGVFLSSYQIDWGTKIEGVDADGKPVDGGPIKNMYLYVRDENDNIVRFYSAATSPALTEDLLKEQLATGLTKGQSMTIYNLRYKISEADWAKGGDTFTNVVNTTAEASGKLVTGTADWKVHKQDLNAQPIHIYNWVNKDLDDTDWQSREEKLTKAELVQPVVDAGKTVPNNADIVLCNSAGLESENAALWSEDYTNVINNVTLADDDSITYTSKAPGMVTIYYKIKGIGYNDHVFHFDVITYGVADNVYVLDYGLNVELNKEYGFRENDHLSVPQNINEKNLIWTMNVHQDEHQWGEFVANGTGLKLTDSVEYRPKDIIDGCDSITVTIQLRESDADTTRPLKFYGVDMDQNVSTAPANVVYYEENHPGITYVNTDENNWIHYETVDSNNNSTADKNQDADQDSNYGSDSHYESDKTGTLVQQGSVGTVVEKESVGAVESTTTLNLDTSDLDAVQRQGIEKLNELLGLGGADSNGTVNKLEINSTTEEVMYFEFKGTGFEIISRTTAEDYPIILVEVQKKISDTQYQIVRVLPVICESKGGTLYQVPVISVTGLDKATYRVVLKAGTTGVQKRVLYIDGVRIYGPLEGSEEALKYYNPEEYKAEFFEVKQLIQNGQVIYADASDSEDNFLMVTGTTLVEDQNANTVLTSIESVEDYMQVGPNNELYLDGVSSAGMIAFVLKPIAKDENGDTYPENARTLEIGAHRKTDSLDPERKCDVYMICGSTADAIYDSVEGDPNFYTVSSGTEMYYTVDVEALGEPRADGTYLVMIAANGSSYVDPEDEFAVSNDCLALTNIKVAGYEITSVLATLEVASDQGTLAETPIVYQTFGLLKARLAAAMPEIDTVPVNEEMMINSAALRATKVVSGKTAILTVKADAEAQTVVITDADGNIMENFSCTRKVSAGVATFTINWKVTGSRGQSFTYTIRVYDEDKLASVNTETVTVTVK